MLWNQHSMRLVTEHNVVISKKERVREGVGEKKSWLKSLKYKGILSRYVLFHQVVVFFHLMSQKKQVYFFYKSKNFENQKN